ncbi:MAG: TVP38/TMEM64 family protein [Pseudomonadota bacterium]
MVDTQPVKKSGWTRWALIALALGALVAGWSYLPVQEWIASFQTWVESQGAFGVIAFIVVYALATFALVPGSPLTLAAGVAFGLWGFPIVVVAATIGAAISFLAARYVFHERVQTKIQDYPKFRAVNEAIREEGWRVVLLLRLSPAFPFSLQNWFLGVTPVGFWPSTIATFFGILPGTLLYIWIADLGASAGAGDMSILKYVLFGVGILATLVVTVVVSKKAAQKLKEATESKA